MFSYLFDNEIFAYRVPEMEQCSLPHKLCSTIPTIPICRYEGLQSEAVRFISHERYLPRASDIERLIQCHLWSQNSEGLQGGEDWREWQIERAVKGRETYSRWSLVRAFEDLLFWDHPFRKIECMNGVHLILFWSNINMRGKVSLCNWTPVWLDWILPNKKCYEPVWIQMLL